MEKKKRKHSALALRAVVLMLTVMALLITMAFSAFAEEAETGESENTDQTLSSLVVKKTAEVASNGKYTFTVTLSDKSINGEFKGSAENALYMTFEDGVSTFELADNAAAAAEGLPSGITYEITVDDKGDSISTVNSKGELEAGKIAVAVFDTYDPKDSSNFNLFDILLVPMGYVIRVCYMITHNYAVALLLFAVVMQLVLLPRVMRSVIKFP